MRCPNCGNENPPDYVFCDECGARLQAGEDTGIAAQGAATGTGAADQSQVAGVVPVVAGGQAQQGYGADAGYGSSQGGQAQASTTAYGGAYPGQVATTGEIGSDSGPMDAGAIGGGQAQWDASGVGTGASTAGGDLGGGSGYNSGQQATQATYGEDKGFGAGPSATSAQGVSTAADYGAAQGTSTAAAAPVTEDTMQTGGGGQSQTWQPGADDSDIYAPSAQAGEDEGTAMPGVLEIDGGSAQADQGAAGYAPVASGETYSDTAASTGGQAAGGGQGAWASQALNLLDRAQAAMGRGDWAAFGNGMSELRAFLTGLGATTSTGAWTAGSYDAAPSDATASTSQAATSTSGQVSGYGGSDTSAGQSSTYGGYNEPAYSGGTSAGATDDAPTLEPQAEAGTLGAQEDTGYGVDYADTGDGGAGASQAAPATQDAGAGTSSDAGSAQPAAAGAGAGAGMMSQEASPAAAGGASMGGATAGGAAVSPNGTVENMMARLVIISTGAELPLPDQEEIMVGREDPSSGIFPDVDLTAYGGEEGGVSRRHARLLHINGDYFVEDLQSTNFTKLDGQRLPAHVRERLEDGARIDFGRVATIFRRS
ncbi:MAG: FHA domain-containing protein [Chloroflexota bacterium]|nr:FHA domain-containing protein [Chloroflexota bacterium]MDQ5865187.1 FHA domain-containing protein [Chloroflexota bacterium]